MENEHVKQLILMPIEHFTPTMEFVLGGFYRHISKRNPKSKAKPIIAGGAARYALFGGPKASDVDVYFNDPSEAWHFKTYLAENGWTSNGKVWSKEGYDDINYIDFIQFSSIDHLLNSFDMTITQAALVNENAGFAYETTREDCFDKLIRFTDTAKANTTYSVRKRYFRIKKYIEKGFIFDEESAKEFFTEFSYQPRDRDVEGPNQSTVEDPRMLRPPFFNVTDPWSDAPGVLSDAPVTTTTASGANLDPPSFAVPQLDLDDITSYLRNVNSALTPLEWITNNTYTSSDPASLQAQAPITRSGRYVTPSDIGGF